MLNRALAIIHDEHRSLGAVLHGLRFLVREMQEKGSEPDFKLLWAMLHYMDAFSERLHHPKEDAYLFARLRERTREADEIIATLEQQHVDSAERLRQLEQALGQLEAGAPGSLEAFGENGDPRFGAKPDHEFRDLFTRIVNLAPPPIGVGPAHG